MENQGYGAWKNEDFINDIKEILKDGNISDDIIRKSFACVQQSEDFSKLAIFRDKPGVYRDFLSKVVAYIPMVYAGFKLEESIEDIKKQFNFTEQESWILLSEAINIHKSRSISSSLEKFSLRNVNEDTVSDFKKSPIKFMDGREEESNICH